MSRQDKQSHERLARHEWPKSFSFTHQKLCKPKSLDELSSVFPSNPSSNHERASLPSATRVTALDHSALNKLVCFAQPRWSDSRKPYLSWSSSYCLTPRGWNGNRYLTCLNHCDRQYDLETSYRTRKFHEAHYSKIKFPKRTMGRLFRALTCMRIKLSGAPGFECDIELLWRPRSWQSLLLKMCPVRSNDSHYNNEPDRGPEEWHQSIANWCMREGVLKWLEAIGDVSWRRNDYHEFSPMPGDHGTGFGCH